MTASVQTADTLSPALDTLGRRPGVVVVAYAGAVFLTLLPLLLVKTPPLVDLPAHLARLHILATDGHNPILSSIYQSNWTILPNLAMEGVILPLAKIMPLEAASRIFIGLTILLMIAGAALLHRVVHGYWSAWPASAALFVYGLPMFWGFVGFLFTMGLALCAFAAWIATEGWRPGKRIGLFTAIAIVLFFGHLFALGVYGLCVVAYEFGRNDKWRSLHPNVKAVRLWALTLAQFAAPLVLWLMAPTRGSSEPVFYGTIIDKLGAVLSPSVFYGNPIDRVMYAVLGVLVIRGLFSGCLTVAPALKVPLIVLGIAAVLMPSKMFGTWGADLRLPTVMALVFIGSTTLRMENRRLAAGLVALVVVLFTVRMGVIAQSWREFDRQITDFRTTLKMLPEGASILPAETEWRSLATRTYWHLATYAVIDRSAFVPTLFTDPTQQPIRLTPRYASEDPGLVPPIPLDLLVETLNPDEAKFFGEVAMKRDTNRIWLGWPKKFDYLLLLRGEELENPVPSHLHRIASGPFYDLYKINP